MLIPINRYVLSVVFAAATTSALLLLMQHLIRDDRGPTLDESRRAFSLDFAPEIVEPPPEREPPQPPAEPEREPPFIPEQFALLVGGGGSVELTIKPPEPGLDPSIGQGDYSVGAVPVLMPAPEYPPAAERRGIEGYVLLEFNVSSAGAVADPRIVESMPINVFDRAALRALSRYKYKPRVVDGVPRPIYGVTQKIVFEMSN